VDRTGAHHRRQPDGGSQRAYVAASPAAINFDTIILLFGMMIVVANLQLSGFFALVAERVVEHAHPPACPADRDRRRSVSSLHFFVNDTMCWF